MASLIGTVKNMLAERLMFGLTPAQEERFRLANLAADVVQARFCILLLVFPIVAYAVNDYIFLGFSRLFYVINAWRLALLAYTWLLYRKVGRAAAYRDYDRAVLRWEIILALTIVGIAATRPGNFYGHMVPAMMSVFIVALALPNRFANQLAVSSAIVLGEAAVVLRNPQQPQALVVTVLTLLSCPLVAFLSSWQLHLFRRKTFAAGEKAGEAELELRARNEELELFNRAMVGRELRMVELKKEVNRLSAQAGLPPPYALGAAEDRP